MADHGTLQPPQSCEPILYNKDLYPIGSVSPENPNTLELDSLRSYLASATSQPYKLKQIT